MLELLSKICRSLKTESYPQESTKRLGVSHSPLDPSAPLGITHHLSRRSSSSSA